MGESVRSIAVSLTSFRVGDTGIAVTQYRDVGGRRWENEDWIDGIRDRRGSRCGTPQDPPSFWSTKTIVNLLVDGTMDILDIPCVFLGVGMPATFRTVGHRGISI
jgi:hypothetical protein